MPNSRPPHTFPFAEGPLSSIPPYYAERRASCPFGEITLASGQCAVLLVDYRDVAAALANPAFSHDLTAPGSPRIFPGESLLDVPDLIMNMEGERHLRLRRIVASAFTPRRAEARRGEIRALADELLDRVDQASTGAFDLVADYAFPLPVHMMCAVLGVPALDRESFRWWIEALMLEGSMTQPQREAALGEFAEYVAELIATRRSTPQDGLIDHLIAARDGDDRLSENELNYLLISLLAVGYETVHNALGRAVLLLLGDGRRLWGQLCDEPRLIPTTVDELLRLTLFGNGAQLRLATRDVELPHGVVRAGQAVLIAVAAAQRDPDVYPDADRVCFDRGIHPQLHFGAGPHYCLGAHLARVELQVALAALLERYPRLRLAVLPENLRFTAGNAVHTLTSLPVMY